MSINPLQGKVSDFADPSTLQGKVGVAAVGALSSRVVQHLLKNLRDQTTLSVGRIFLGVPQMACFVLQTFSLLP